MTEAKVALTSLFIGTYSKILPYANALLMVVTQVSKAIADMFGIELTDYNSGIASSEDAYIDLEESIEGATDAVKELKRQTLGFDQINNISENKDNTSNLSGGIDQRLLDAITSYENGMGKVRMEATKIRDRIMEWLGFTKDIDAITEEVSFKFTDTDSLLYKIVKSLKDIVTNGKDAISKVFNIIKEDFDNGIFGYLLLGVFESISNILGLIADNERVATIIARILETLILIKGLQMIPGVKNLGRIITGELIGTAGATNGLGATGLLGTFTLLTAVAGVWTIELIYKTVDAATQALKTNANTINEVVTGAMDARRKFFDLAKAGDTTSESFNELTEYMLDNIKRSQELAKSTSLTKEQQNLLNQTNNNTLEIIKKLADEGLITEDMYWKFAEAIKGADAAVLNLNPNLEDGKNKTFYFEEECRKAKDSVDTLTGNISNYKDELGLLNDKTSTSKTNLDGLKDGLKNLGDSAYNSKDKVKELNDNLGLTKSKQITIDIDANTNKFSNKLTNAIAGAFGALGAIGTRANGGIYTNGNWHNIPQYANGGAPSHGTMFVAGEAGAEIVGNINGRTEVLNQSQIASAIYSAVLAAMSQANSSANKVDVDVRVHSDGSVVVDEINQTTKQTGVCPIYIPAT